jgi:hypothetical protein
MNTNPTERRTWRVTAFVCECERIGLHVLRTDGSRVLEGANLVERIGEDWRGLAQEVATEMLKRTGAPAGDHYCCILASTLLRSEFRSHRALEAAYDADVAMEAELYGILHAAAADLERKESAS